MARIKRGILGGFQGKVANVVGSSWKGIETMRSLPLSVLNPRTTAQVSNRTRFASVSGLAAEMLTTIVKPLNDRFAQQMSGYNMFCSRNQAVFNANGEFVPTGLTLSSGKLGDAVISSADGSSLAEVSISWPTTLNGAFESATDKVYVAIIDGNGAVAYTSSGVLARSVGTLSVSLPTDGSIVGTPYAYLSFMRVDGTMVANSAFKAIEII